MDTRQDNSDDTKHVIHYTQHVYRLVKKVTIALMVSALLQLLGIILPGWLVAVSPSKTYHIGILFMIICDERDTCEFNPSVLLAPAGLFPSIETGELLVETLCGFMACCLGVILLQCSVRMCHLKQAGLVMCTIMSVLTATLSLTAAGKMADLTILTTTSTAIQGVDTYQVPYALILTGIGGLISGVCFMILLLKLVHDFKGQSYCAGQKRDSDDGFFKIMTRTLITSGILILAGFVSPGWIVCERAPDVYQVGLFYASVCSDRDCSTRTSLFSFDGSDHPPYYYAGNIFLREVKGYAISGFLFYVVTCVTFRVSINKVQVGKKAGLVVTLIASTLSALLLLVAVGKTSVFKVETAFTEDSGPVIYRIPYSLFLAGLGGTLIGLFSIAMLLKLIILFRQIARS